MNREQGAAGPPLAVSAPLVPEVLEAAGIRLWSEYRLLLTGWPLLSAAPGPAGIVSAHPIL